MKSGFTLIEIVTALGVFSIIVLLVAGIFTNYSVNSHRSIASQEIQESLRPTFETLTREIRSGFGNTFAVSGDNLTFRNQNGACVKYSLIAEQVVRQLEAASNDVDCEDLNYESGSLETLTDPDISITDLSFFAWPAEIEEEDEGDVLVAQGYVTVVVMAQAQDELAAGVPVSLQTTVASRQTFPWNNES